MDSSRSTPAALAHRRRPAVLTSVLVMAAMAVMVTQSISAASAAGPSIAPTSGAAPELALPPTATPRVAPAIGIIIPHPAWINVTNSTPGDAPPASYGSASAYDPVDNVTVSFGGCPAVGGCPSDQTWVFAGGVWTNVTEPTDAPPATVYPSMDFDANLGAILLFGGCLDQNCSLVSNATWTYSNGTWTNVSFFGPAPPARGGASMAFDPQPEENGSVLFGGCVAGIFGIPFCYNDTWVWQGDGGWVNLTPSIAPAYRGFAQMAYDADIGAIVLFGGLDVFSIYSDTWELYSGQWWNVTPKESPPGRAFGGMVELPDDAGVMMFGGLNASAVDLSDTWVFGDGEWSVQAPTASPPARANFGFALDATGTTVLLEGGDNSTIDFGDTWAYEFAPYVTISPSVGSSEVGEKVTFNVTAGDGTPPYRIGVSFGDGALSYPTGEGPYFAVTHTYETPGTYNVSVYLTDAVGATSSEINMSFSVTPGPSVTAEAVPSQGDVGFPVAFESTVLAAGAPPLNFTWEFGDHTSAYGSSASHTYSAAGTYTVKLKAKDQDDVTDTVTFSLVIAPDPTLKVAATSTSPSVGASPTFFANVSNGSGPFRYAWYFGDGTRSALPTPQHAYSHSGSYTVKVWVNDSAGASSYATLTVTVPSSTSGAWGSIGAAPLWFWGGVAALAAVGAGGSVVLLRRGRARKP